MSSLPRLFVCLLLSIFLSSIFIAAVPSPSYGLDKKKIRKKVETIVRQVLKGELFLGGKPPKLKDFLLAKEVKVDGKYYYMYKAYVERCSGDKNGSLILFKARTYGDALAKLLGVSPSSKRTFDLFFPVSIDKTKFPPVKMVYDYIIEARNNEGVWKISDGVARAKGDKHFIEPLTFGLQPGKYEISIFSSVDVGDHPIKTMYDVAEWVVFLMDPVGSIVDTIVENTEYGLVDMVKDQIKGILITKATTTKPKFSVEVLAKVPSLKGLVPSNAVSELSARLLTYKEANTTDCSAASFNKVIGQSPAPGRRLKKGKPVTLRICRKEDRSGGGGGGGTGTYAAWIRPDRLTCCTAPGPIYTYQYQSGLQSSMPSNGILLQGGFATQDALLAWACGRPVHYHYWATNWAAINGYTVSSLPCKINA